ncbi:MAG TPA: hypothetical protein DIU39_05870 [Flavobacteriales bacterium]|nr:hypothetical protein [Flavobacteriales bacterium]|tara:strand:- start:74 stop:613 length:540 start_codon:yes stop_codon:yes gene_type:complete
MKKILKITGVVLISVLVACSGNKQESDFDKVMPNKGGDFRGLNLNSPKEEVLEIEGKEGLVEEGDDYLDYTRIINPDERFSYNLSMEFDDKGLYIITMDVFVEDESNKEESIKRGHELYNAFVKHFTEKFGQPAEKEDNLYTLWEFKAKNGGNASEATVKDFSEEDGYGSVTVSVGAIE